MSVNRQILALSWPAIATNITTPLLSLADVAIVGHLEKPNLIGAVAVGGTVFNILYWMFGFLRMGTTGITAQAFGAADRPLQLLTLMRSGFVALSATLVLWLFTPLVGFHIITLIDGSGAVTADAWLYFRIVIIGAPGVLLNYVFSGWLLGLQRTRPIMWIALFTNVFNVILSYCLVYVFNLGIAGVGLGTAVSQLAGAVIGACVVFRVKRKLLPDVGIRKIMPDFWLKKAWRSLMSVNRDIFFRTVCLAAVTLWFTHVGAGIGGNFLSANALLMQFFMLFSYFMDGFAFSGEALAGRFYGARRFEELKKCVRALIGWGVVTSAVFTVLYFVLGDLFISLLTTDTGARLVAHDYLLWAVTIPFLSFAAFTWDGVFIGLTLTRYLLIAMLLAVALFFGIYFMGRALSLSVENENHLLWFAFVVYLAVRGIAATFFYKRFLKTAAS